MKNTHDLRERTYRENLLEIKREAELVINNIGEKSHFAIRKPPLLSRLAASL